MIRIAALLLLLLFAQPAAADELRPGYIEFSQIGKSDWRLIWKAPLNTGVTPRTQPILPNGCTIAALPTREPSVLAVVTTASVFCSGPVDGGIIGLSNFEGSQTDVLVRVAMLDRPMQMLRLTAANPLAKILPKAGRWQVGTTYFVSGVEHILIGYDHLLFVVSLVLLLSGIGTIVKAVTAFTVAHSITLVGTTLGWLGLPQRPVEAVIALSIIFLAVEIIKKTPEQPRLSQRIPWMVAFLFGLLHGFGFAGALNEIGLPESDVAMALFTFNLGVEAGQLLIVLATIALTTALRKFQPALYQPGLKVATYAIGITASYWFVERMIG